ncbi:spore cortex biosynthesis protein YabQ [Senegalia massiliensis]|uniref:Spore cortex biosynthesis protein YabQ n=1 Tax=Senegalia massiliensis TaxID=1720316 RepID=A0A845QYE2_9CLOT|nr:spore cortex biosynthesis protein YabQ [Senegalia massiliensis]NBI07495.1 spore cortex biosynthesis protein YabQ [Senegalia massiliensis]
MSNLVLEQFYILIKLIIGGIILGLIYDLYRVFRYYLKPKKIATMIEDTIFFILISIIVLFLLFYTNSAELRWYVFLGFLVGSILYKIIFSKYIIKILIFIMNKIIKVFKKTLDTIISPIKILINIIKILLKKILKWIKKGYKDNDKRKK